MKGRASLLLALLALSVMAASAADVTGKWGAQMPGRNGGTQEITFNLKAAGSTVTCSPTMKIMSTVCPVTTAPRNF